MSNTWSFVNSPVVVVYHNNILLSRGHLSKRTEWIDFSVVPGPKKNDSTRN